MKYRYEIATAGLVHDIGKLYQKSTSSSLYRSKSYEHPLIAGDFVDKFKDIFLQVFSSSELDFIKECAVRHHTGQAFQDSVNPDKASGEMKKYCNIINYADNISSGERSVVGGVHGNKEGAVMHPILTYAEKSKYGLKVVNTEKTQQCYKLTKYSDYRLKITAYKTNNKELVYHSEEDYTKFISAFEKDVIAIKADTKEDFFNKLMFVIRDYTWCVPSDASDLVHDISLYQHLVTTSGIAVALYSNADSEDFFNNFAKNASESWNVLTLTLDKAEEYVLGTSSYGVAVLDEINNNYAKVLSVIDTVVKSILDKYELTSSCILIQNNSFEKYIIVPSAVCDDIKDYLREVNQFLFNEFEGTLLFSYSLSRLYNKEEKMKSLFSKSDYYMQGIKSVLCDEGGWNSDKVFVGEKTGKYDKALSGVVPKVDIKSIVGSTNRFALVAIDADKVIDTMRTGFEGRDTISRIATYSSILSDFFSDVIPSMFEDSIIINVNANRVIFICNSDSVLENMTDLMDNFKAYTNDKLTLSIAVQLLNVNQRLFSLADLFDKHLRSIKESGGNAVYYSGLILTYDELQDYINTVAMITESVENGTPKSILHKLKLYSQMYRSYVDDGNVLGLKFYSNFRGYPKKFADCSPALFDFLSSHINAIGENPKEEDRLFYMLQSIAYDSELRLKGEN